MKLLSIGLVLLAVSNICYADQYGNDFNDPISDMNRQNQFDQAQRNQQIQMQQQQRQLEDMQRANDQLQRDIQRQRMINSGNSGTNSLADELYR